MRHEKTPFSLSSNIDKAIFFFIIIKKIFKLINFIILNHIHSLIQMFLNQETSITIIILSWTITITINWLELVIIESKRILSLVLILYLIFYSYFCLYYWVIFFLKFCLSVVTYRTMFVCLLSGRFAFLCTYYIISFYLYAIYWFLVFVTHNLLLALKCWLTNSLSSHTLCLWYILIEHHSILIKNNTGFITCSKDTLLTFYIVKKLVLLNNKSDIIVFRSLKTMN